LNVSHDVAAFARRAAQAVTDSTKPNAASVRPSAQQPTRRCLQAVQDAIRNWPIMTLRELERRGRQRRASFGKRWHLPIDDDDAVLTFKEWCALNGFSPRTGRRILNAPGAPIVTQLSPKRIGITRGNNRRWQASKARA
jgi:hypothetical protein